MVNGSLKGRVLHTQRKAHKASSSSSPSLSSQNNEPNENVQEPPLSSSNNEEPHLSSPNNEEPPLLFSHNEEPYLSSINIDKDSQDEELDENIQDEELDENNQEEYNLPNDPGNECQYCLTRSMKEMILNSVQNDAAFCFYYFLFKDDAKCPGGDAFVKAGWNNWDKPIRYLLKQGLAYRGHQESESSSNRGNFLELLKWLAEKYETIAKVVLSKAPKNHKATSPKIQKGLIKCCSKETTKLIIEDLDNDLFAILADESSDVSHKEQLAICLSIVKVDDTTSLTLMKAIETLLGDHKLLMSNIRGQGYDGFSNMRGEINGLKNLITRNSPSAYYVHCFIHQLQLTLVVVPKENCDCASFFQQLGFVLNAIEQSCKKLKMVRETHAKKVLEALGLNEIVSGQGLNQELGLSRLRDTRWGSHYKSIMNLIVMYSSIIDVLVKVGKDAKSKEDRIKAQSVVDHLESFEFIFMLHLMKVIFGYTNSLCEALKRKDQDIVIAVTLVDLTKKYLQDTRDHEWDSFLQSVCVFCAKLNIDVPSMSDYYAPRGRSRCFFDTKTNLE
ncbi:uncharacterized protein LOC141630881 [Silene latifolia]|uniref:uncharacterized protein LOC141630881 n=1 Tax=Silene latifolia TaxID=37657 RepID=UPI003D773926